MTVFCRHSQNGMNMNTNFRAVRQSALNMQNVTKDRQVKELAEIVEQLAAMCEELKREIEGK